MTALKVFKTHPDIKLPEFATKEAACFDLAAQFAGKSDYKGYTKENGEFSRAFDMYNNAVVVMPGERVMVPTGLIFDIPKGYSIRVHPRSGLSFKQGLVLANLEGVIDSDYYHETMVLLVNTSQIKATVNNGDRISQAELVKCEDYKITETKTAPAQKTDRTGGMGSTGVKANVKL